MSLEKYVLDIGGHNGKFVFERALDVNDEQYVVIDNEIPLNRFDSPQGAYNYMKSVLSVRALKVLVGNEPEAEAVKSLKVPRITHPTINNYNDIIKDALPMLMKNPRLRKRLENPITDYRKNGYSRPMEFIRNFVDSEMILIDFIRSEIPGPVKDKLKPYCDRIRFIKGDGKRLPFPAGCFDMVYANFLPESVRDRIIRCARRVSKNYNVRNYAGKLIS